MFTKYICFSWIKYLLRCSVFSLKFLLYCSFVQCYTSINVFFAFLKFLTNALLIMSSHIIGVFWIFFTIYCIQHCFICRPSDSTVSEDAGPRTVATLALADRRSNHSARSHPLSSMSVYNWMPQKMGQQFMSQVAC